ncbi:MAG: hypothetical protein EZS28_004627 [Streblomastix strix]|uniref:Uncharacterized protein n=1 Tax=Streblomastix strix TaxID=222440 RepID=A0A5J4WZ95_9EUKA|nr:MAG: hypothetical protein EZS28_004627 [Streblomastix strix]
MNLNTAALQNTAFACGTSFTIPSNAYETSIINNSVVDLKVIYLDTDEQNRTESPYLFPEKTSGQNSPRRHRFRSAHSSHGKKHAEKAHWSSTDTGTNILSNPHDSIDHALNLHGIQSIHRSSIGRVKVNPIQTSQYPNSEQNRKAPGKLQIQLLKPQLLNYIKCKVNYYTMDQTPLLIQLQIQISVVMSNSAHKLIILERFEPNN